MADVTLDPQNSNPKELYWVGVRAFVLQDYDTAVDAFTKASELLVAEHGDDAHDSLGDIHLYYGKSLLELSRRDSGPLGEAVLKTVDEESEEEADEAEDDNKQDEAKLEDEVNGATTESEETKEDKPEEEVEGSENKEKGKESEETVTEEGESSTDKKEGENEDELTDLQVAWEVLELAKRIFTNRGADGKKNLAETLIVLGEVSLESGNFSSAIEDMTEGLKIQKTLFGNDSRTIAETYYKLGGAYSTDGQIDQAIESFNASYEYLQNKITNLQKDEENKDKNEEEIKELNGLLPEIKEKIADMKTLKAEVANKMVASVDEGVAKTNGTSQASSSKQVNDISHLVKRKRKDEDVEVENPPKRPSP